MTDTSDSAAAGRSGHAHAGADPTVGVPGIVDAEDLSTAGRIPGAAVGARRRPRADRRADEELGIAWPRRRRLPDRIEVVVPAPGRRKAALPGGQRGRGRTRYLQGHSLHDGRSARLDRRLHHHLLRDPQRVLRHLRPRRGHPLAPPVDQRRQRGQGRRIPRPEHPRLRVQPGDRHPRRRRGVHLRRGNGPAGFARRTSRSAATQAAVPGGGGPVRLPDRGQQRRDHRLGAGHRVGRQRLVPVDGHRQVAGPQDLFAVRTRHPAGPVRGADGHHASPATGVGRRHAGRHPTQVLHSWRVFDADLHSPASGRAAVLRRRGRRRLDARHHCADVFQRNGFRAVGGVEVAGVLQARVMRQVHAVPRGYGLAGADSAPGSFRHRDDGGPRHHGRRRRQHRRPVVLRPGRRGGHPDPVRLQVLPRRVRGPGHRRTPPVVSPDCWLERTDMSTAADAPVRRRSRRRRKAGPGRACPADHRRRRWSTHPRANW